MQRLPMAGLAEKVTAYVDRHALLKTGDRIIAGVSGGADSIVLLDILVSLREQFSLDILVAHFNHCLRNSESDRDEQFTAKTARQYQLRFLRGSGDTAAFAAEQGASLETAARTLRMNFFSELVREYGCTGVCLGHHAGDQAETVLMNLIRGSGPLGLAGIKPRSGIRIHPLLEATRKEILAHARSRGLSWIEDSSNEDTVFFRNRIRHQLLPCYSGTAGRDVVPSICRAAVIQNEMDEVLIDCAKQLESTAIISRSSGEIILDIYNFLTYLNAVQKRFLVMMLAQLSGRPNPVSYKELERLTDMIKNRRSGTELNLGCGVQCTVSTGRAVLRRRVVHLLPRVLPVGQRVTAEELNLWIQLDILPRTHVTAFHPERNIEYLDSDCIKRPLRMRAVRPGDAFVPLGMTGKKKLQDFFVDEKVPVYDRNTVPLITGGKEIICVLGYRIDNRFRVTGKTREVLKIEFHKIIK